MNWKPAPDNDRLLHCVDCEATFPVGGPVLCTCDRGNALDATHDSDVQEPRGSSSGALPTTSRLEAMLLEKMEYYERKLNSNAKKARRLGKAYRKIEFDGGDWQFVREKARLVLDCIVAERGALKEAATFVRQTLGQAVEYAYKRELPDSVDRLEAIKIAIDTGRTLEEVIGGRAN